MNDNDAFLDAARQLIDAGRFIDSKGWVPATSGNFSARLPNGTIAITVSGKHKGQLQLDDIMLIDADANSLNGKKPCCIPLYINVSRTFSLYCTRILLMPPWFQEFLSLKLCWKTMSC
jgi:ribulose-5-phosphate 4-epimerase/fuculose-1-phosphate aldolase